MERSCLSRRPRRVLTPLTNVNLDIMQQDCPSPRTPNRVLTPHSNVNIYNIERNCPSPIMPQTPLNNGDIYNIEQNCPSPRMPRRLSTPRTNVNIYNIEQNCHSPRMPRQLSTSLNNVNIYSIEQNCSLPRMPRWLSIPLNYVNIYNVEQKCLSPSMPHQVSTSLNNEDIYAMVQNCSKKRDSIPQGINILMFDSLNKSQPEEIQSNVISSSQVLTDNCTPHREMEESFPVKGPFLSRKRHRSSSLPTLEPYKQNISQNDLKNVVISEKSSKFQESDSEKVKSESSLRDQISDLYMLQNNYPSIVEIPNNHNDHFCPICSIDPTIRYGPNLFEELEDPDISFDRFDQDYWLDIDTNPIFDLDELLYGSTFVASPKTLDDLMEIIETESQDIDIFEMETEPISYVMDDETDSLECIPQSAYLNGLITENQNLEADHEAEKLINFVQDSLMKEESPKIYKSPQKDNSLQNNHLLLDIDQSPAINQSPQMLLQKGQTSLGLTHKSQVQTPKLELPQEDVSLQSAQNEEMMQVYESLPISLTTQSLRTPHKYQSSWISSHMVSQIYESPQMRLHNGQSFETEVQTPKLDSRYQSSQNHQTPQEYESFLPYHRPQTPCTSHEYQSPWIYSSPQIIQSPQIDMSSVLVTDNCPMWSQIIQSPNVHGPQAAPWSQEELQLNLIPEGESFGPKGPQAVPVERPQDYDPIDFEPSDYDFSSDEELTVD